jgi:hypothetical protein
MSSSWLVTKTKSRSKLEGTRKKCYVCKGINDGSVRFITIWTMGHEPTHKCRYCDLLALTLLLFVCVTFVWYDAIDLVLS